MDGVVPSIPDHELGGSVPEHIHQGQDLHVGSLVHLWATEMLSEVDMTLPGVDNEIIIIKGKI